MAHDSKRYKALRTKVERMKLYPMRDALTIVKENATAKFNESVDVSINLGVDAKKSDQAVRGSIVLPQGTGKSVRVAVFAQGDRAQQARDAGADVVGFEDLANEIKGGKMDFDVTLAVKNAKAGQVQYRTDKGGIVQCTIGRASFTVDALEENFKALVDAVNKARPATAKGVYLRKVSVTSTMGIGVRVDQATLSQQAQ